MCWGSLAFGALGLFTGYLPIFTVSGGWFYYSIFAAIANGDPVVVLTPPPSPVILPDFPPLPSTKQPQL